MEVESCSDTGHVTKIAIFKNSRWRTAATLKMIISQPLITRFNEIWCADTNFGSKNGHVTNYLLSALYSDVRKKIYRCTSTFSALNYCSEIFFKSVSYLYEVVRINLSPIFRLFAIFDHNFAKIVAPPSNKNENYVVHHKEQSILKKSAENRIKIEP